MELPKITENSRLPRRIFSDNGCQCAKLPVDGVARCKSRGPMVMAELVVAVQRDAEDSAGFGVVEDSAGFGVVAHQEGFGHLMAGWS